MSLHRLLAALVGLLLASCANSSVARDTFASSHTCPSDRVSVTPRPDLWRFSFVSPKPDVAADPERLRVWQERQKKAAADALPCVVFEMDGCGQSQLLCCTHSYHDPRGGTAVNPAHPTCDPMQGPSDN
jgi:hypothetical protein